MAHSKVIPELDGSPGFEGKCEELRRFLFPEPLASLPYINDDLVTPLQDLSEAFDVVTTTEVARALKSVNTNSADVQFGIGLHYKSFQTYPRAI
jgi:hypothetical protein